MRFRTSDCDYVIACYAADKHRYDPRPVRFWEETLGDAGARIPVNSEKCTVFSGANGGKIVLANDLR